MNTSYDVLVIGGGTAGIIAAIQAGRAGARTLLVEKTGMLGGTMTNGLIPWPSSFHAYGRQVIAGIGWELCCRVRSECGELPPEPPVARGQSGGRACFSMNPAVLAAVADEMVLAAGVDLLFHAMPATVRFLENGWRATLCTKTGLHEIAAATVVDCTGDANAVEMAGFEVVRNPDIQPATLVVETTGYDASSLNYDAIQQAFMAEVAAGRMRLADPGWHNGDFSVFLRGHGGNCIHLPDVHGRTSEERTHAEIEGRQAMLRILRFCRRQPGLENFAIARCAPECGIRETVTIKGKKTVGIADYESGRRWDDAVCYSFYVVDIHRPVHIDMRHFQPGTYPTIPLGAMLPAGSLRIIVAGRCIAGDQEANSAYRVQASCMAMGQAAGAAAALAAKARCDFTDLSVEDIRSLLHSHGAIVPFAVS